MSIADIFAKSRNNVISSVQAFPDIDIDATAKNLRVKEHAREAAAAGLPQSDSRNFDATESAIIAEIEADAKRSVSKYLAEQKAYTDRAKDAASAATEIRLRNAAADARIAFERETKMGKEDLYEIKRRLIDTERDLEVFRRKHNLLRPVRNQKALASVLNVLGFILAIEAVMNGYFFSKGSQFGIAGGIFAALIIAALNVAIGFLVGRFVFPWLNYRLWAARVPALMASILYLAGAFTFNLAVAHYRLAMAAEQFEAASVAFNTFSHAPFGIHDFESWALFVVGILFSLIAAYEGFHSEDPYPGYGRRTRASNEVIKEYADEKDALLSALDEIRDGAELTMDDAARSLASREDEYQSITIKSNSLKAELETHFLHLQAAGRTLLQIYRDENTKHRPEPSSRPARFNDVWSIAMPVIGSIETVRPLGEADVAAIRKTINDAPVLREQLHDACRIAIAEYSQIDELVASGARS